MEYFFYCRDKPDSAAIRQAIVEQHWAFMDTYDDVMIARGPTLSDDGSGVTGSMHMVDLPVGPGDGITDLAREFRDDWNLAEGAT